MKVFKKLTAPAVMLIACILKQVVAGCPPGQFGQEGSCMVCPYDYYCPGGTLEPLQCPPGFTSYDGESSCRKSTEEEYGFRLTRALFACTNQPGYYCSGSSIVECADGNYCTGDGSGSINQCPKGYRCMKADEYTLCPDGYYSNLGDDYCHRCPAGQYCNSGVITGAGPTNCGTGYYALDGATGCTICPVGHMCPNKDEAPEKCTGGLYQENQGQTSCSNCPAGYSCTSSSKSGCSGSYYSTSGISYCLPCPAGYSCSGGILGSACSTGYYSPEGTAGCSQCTATNNCPEKNAQYKCLEGYYSSAGATTCTICPAGSYCTGGVQYSCVNGYYSDDTGLSECKPVPTHYVGNSKTGASSISKCDDDEYAEDDYLTCTPCDEMHQCFNDDSVEPCPYGYARIDNNWYCSPCPPGEICSMDSGGDVTTTAVSTFENALSATLQKYPRYSPLGELVTKICPPNHYCDNDGQIYHICPLGTYPMVTGCEPCPEGKACMTSFAKEETISTGTVSSEGDSFARFVPQGYGWNTGDYWENGQTTTSFVETVSTLGRIKNVGDATGTWSDDTCPLGYTCTVNMYSRCPSTHLGEAITSEENGAIKQDQNILHSYDTMSGFTYSKLEFANIDDDMQCLPCNGGYSCTLGSNPSSCSAGTYSPTGDYQCYACPPGHYCEAKSEAPTKCAFNKYYASTGGTASSSCQACPTGFYAPMGSPQCTTCPAGYECSTGVPIMCEVGQYSTEGELNCSPCQEGYICDKGSGTPTPPENICPKGSYCETVGSNTLLYRCPDGQFGIAEGATDNTWCQNCPPGFVCREGTDDFSKYPCPKGYYCPLASSKETACPEGFFNPNTGGMSSDNCLTCPAGFTCGEATVTPTICPSGKYCPQGSINAIMCPMGTYTGTKKGAKLRAECLPCPAGSYCVEGTVTPEPAPVGYYIPYMGATSLDAAKKCPGGYPCSSTGNYRYTGESCTAGYYCPPGSTTTTDNPCPAGTYSDRTDLWDASQCTTCPAGSYCLAASTLSGVTICPEGYYCPAGTNSASQYPCPEGTYGEGTGLISDTECTNCTAGGGCGSGTGSGGSVSCEEGYYCPAGTTTSTPSDFMAPAGSFINFTGATSEYDNYPCGYGKYCPEGATDPTDCDPGTYSDILRAEECFTCPAGYICAGNGVINPTPCVAGEYSAAGATSCSTCELGYYCYQEATSEDTMYDQECPPGTICDDGGNGLDTSPSLELHGCPRGQYCKGGSHSADCPAGTYNNATGRSSLSDCKTVPAGYYSEAGAVEYESTPCQAGYYCLEGSTTATEYACPAGTFRDIVGGRKPEDCATCWSGYKCPNEATATPEDCGSGNYCPLGTIIPALCPIGTYSAELNLPDSRSCTKCPTGYYCGTKGMTDYTGTENQCDAGFYCVEGATRPDPTDGITGYICPAGGYCLQGTTAVAACPDGEYNPEEGAKDSSSCIACLPGKYCFGTQNPEPTGDCQAGFYCPAGSTSATQNSVQAGHYAPAGSDIEIPCPRGKYQPAAEKESCIDCPAGGYCPDTEMTTPDPCPAGFYCPSNTYFTGSLYYEALICPPGTYNTLASQSDISACVSCGAGEYCQNEGLSAISGNCVAGFYCEFGSLYPNPAFDVDDSDGHYGPCPQGQHCAASTSTPTDCLAGTYSAMTKLEDDTYCKDCEPGHYCETAGLSAPTGECDPGYFCDTASTTAQKSECTATNYCPQGSAYEERCPIGFYNTAAGQGKCLDCGEGNVCFDGAKSTC